jgi:hypothetical protein
VKTTKQLGISGGRTAVVSYFAILCDFASLREMVVLAKAPSRNGTQSIPHFEK